MSGTAALAALEAQGLVEFVPGPEAMFRAFASYVALSGVAEARADRDIELAALLRASFLRQAAVAALFAGTAR